MTDAQLAYAPEPDVYETPAVQSGEESSSPKDDQSQSPVDSASDSDNATAEEDGPFGAISRRSLFPQRARSRFQALGTKIDTKGLDLSDRVDGRRRGLRVRQGHESETLDAKLARLRKEVEECRALMKEPDAPGDTTKEVQELGKLLAELGTNHAAPEVKQPSERQVDKPKDVEEESYDNQTLGRIAAFDTRLSSLERALGIASLDMASDGSFTSPVLPSVELLDQQVSALMTSASIAQLDAAASRVKSLAQDAEQLARLRSVPASKEAGDEAEDEHNNDAAPATFSQDDMTKLNTLYGLIPTLQNLSPTVPALLERMRSLAALHTGAANAANELDAVEKRQADTDAELKSWAEGLKRVESVVKEASEANGRNGKMVQGWVKDLEGRVQALR